jgi:hypothetical protein
MGSGFQSTILRVPIALADFLAQIVQHDTTRTRNAAHLAVRKHYDQLSLLEKQIGNNKRGGFDLKRFGNFREPQHDIAVSAGLKERIDWF